MRPVRLALAVEPVDMLGHLLGSCGFGDWNTSSMSRYGRLQIVIPLRLWVISGIEACLLAPAEARILAVRGIGLR